MIREKLITTQSRQNSYTDKNIRDLEFSAGDYVFLKVLPTTGVLRLEKKDKLSPQFIEPYKILERVGAVAYKLTTTKLVSYSSSIPCFDVTKVYVGSISCIRSSTS